MRQSQQERYLTSPRRSEKRSYQAEAVYVLGLAIYAVLAVLANVYEYFAWDLSLARLIQSLRLPAFDALMVAVSVLGTGWIPFAIVGISGVGLMLLRLRLEALICVVGVSLGALTNWILKSISARPRPVPELIEVLFEYPHLSFPSGHVAFFVEFFGFLFFLSYVLLRRGLLRSWLMISFGLLVAMVGVSRVFVGAHWPSDVLGAYLFSGIWLMLMIDFYRRRKTRQVKRKPASGSVDG